MGRLLAGKRVMLDKAKLILLVPQRLRARKTMNLDPPTILYAGQFAHSKRPYDANKFWNADSCRILQNARDIFFKSLLGVLLCGNPGSGVWLCTFRSSSVFARTTVSWCLPDIRARGHCSGSTAAAGTHICQ